MRYQSSLKTDQQTAALKIKYVKTGDITGFFDATLRNRRKTFFSTRNYEQQTVRENKNGFQNLHIAYLPYVFAILKAKKEAGVFYESSDHGRRRRDAASSADKYCAKTNDAHP